MGEIALRKTAQLLHYTEIFLGSVSYVLRQEPAISLLPSLRGKFQCHWQAYGKENKGEKTKEKRGWEEKKAKRIW